MGVAPKWIWFKNIRKSGWKIEDMINVATSGELVSLILLHFVKTEFILMEEIPSKIRLDTGRILFAGVSSASLIRI